jgi:hypothetical protein
LLLLLGLLLVVMVLNITAVAVCVVHLADASRLTGVLQHSR